MDKCVNCPNVSWYTHFDAEGKASKVYYCTLGKDCSEKK